MLHLVANLGEPVVALQEGEHAVVIEADVGRTVGEHAGIADIETIDEVRLQQSLFEGELLAGALGEPEQSVGEQRVGSQGAVHAEPEPALASDRSDVVDDLLGALHAAELLGVGVDDRAGLSRRCSGIQLIGTEDDVDVDLVGQFGDRRLESPLPDVAPRANDIGPDLDIDAWAHVLDDTARIVTIMTRPAQDVQATFCATLVDEWVRCGVRHAVVAPGSRSTPMALALVDRTDIETHVFVDERSAAFVALGIGVATGAPALLLCTSGTAATHFHAAVVEASQSAVPILVLTADRPSELHGVGAPQTIEQTNLYGDAVRWFHDPGVAADEDRSSWRAVAATAWGRAGGDSPGPVHLNLPFREPLLGVAGELPEVQPSVAPASRPIDIDGVLGLLDSTKGLIVAGNGVDDVLAVEDLAKATGWPVLADPMSGCQALDASVIRFDAVQRHSAFAAAHRPEVVLQLGMPPSSKVLAQWLAGSGAVHVAVSPGGLISDPNLVGARQVHAPIGRLCSQLVAKVTRVAERTWLAEWMAADRTARRVLDSALVAEPILSEPGTARAVTAAMPPGGHLVVASSMPVRDVEWFGTARHDITVHSNRGANGIDGVIATGIGVALGSGAPTTVLLGDVAFCHDLSSLTALQARGLDLTIVVTDNDGGAIFSFLPQATALPPDRFEMLFGTPHGTDIVEVARALGLRAYTAKSADDLAAAFDEPDTSVVRVASDRRVNVEVHATLNDAVVAALG
ncbi:MAG: 2-succinyl-5-enolpyruvyl-6-hydroxy-3-cyclohexene-carboxylate synthase [Ilumatobacteraceae bacterium]|nr:2-succinyl-5-enolpyruvyl-6-hydroxy-3-cyclohexene-carboxylate synthase [Ilumatobacteraceae bacterium]